MKKTFDILVPKKVVIDIDEDRIHAYCGDIITRSNSTTFSPMLVLGTYFEPRFLGAYENNKITEDELHKTGTGYVHAVGKDGIPRVLQYYEYYILTNCEITEEIKKEITMKWDCEKYVLNQRLCKRRNQPNIMN